MTDLGGASTTETLGMVAAPLVTVSLLAFTTASMVASLAPIVAFVLYTFWTR